MRLLIVCGLVVLFVSVVGFLFYWQVYPEIGICGRTAAVRNAIVESLPDVSWCGQVNSAHLETLGSLYLIDSKLKEGDFDGLSNLEVLSLSGNSLVSLPVGVFDNTQNLEYLYLSNNSLVSLPEGVFDNNPELKELQLSGNGLVSLPEGVFDNNPNLTTLSLDNNSLVSLPPGIFANLLKFEYLVTENNGFDCIPRTAFGSRTDDFSQIYENTDGSRITLCDS